MIGNLWQRKKLRPLAYLIPALVLGILILFELTDIPVPILTRDEGPVDHEHIHEGEFFLTDAAVGNQVGTLVPYFELGLADGSTVDLTDMLESGKPTFLYFWSTTWPVCTSELRRLKEIYPEFSQEVALYGVGVHYGISEDIDTLEMYREKNGYPWPVATASPRILMDMGVTVQSTKLAFDSEGIITYRGEMGQGPDAEWREVFVELASGREDG